MNGMDERLSGPRVYAIEGEGSGRFRAFQSSSETIAPFRTFDGYGPGDQAMEPYRPATGLPAGMMKGDVLATPLFGCGACGCGGGCGGKGGGSCGCGGGCGGEAGVTSGAVVARPIGSDWRSRIPGVSLTWRRGASPLQREGLMRADGGFAVSIALPIQTHVICGGSALQGFNGIVAALPLFVADDYPAGGRPGRVWDCYHACLQSSLTPEALTDCLKHCAEVYTGVEGGSITPGVPSGCRCKDENWSCEEICQAAKQDGLDCPGTGRTARPSIAGVVCCADKKCACDWLENSGGARAASYEHGDCEEIEECTREHEGTHFDDVTCDPSKCIHRPPYDPGLNRNDEECLAYLAELVCLRSIPLRPLTTTCQIFLAYRIARTEEQIASFCGS